MMVRLFPFRSLLNKNKKKTDIHQDGQNNIFIILKLKGTVCVDSRVSGYKWSQIQNCFSSGRQKVTAVPSHLSLQVIGSAPVHSAYIHPYIQLRSYDTGLWRTVFSARSYRGRDLTLWPDCLLWLTAVKKKSEVDDVTLPTRLCVGRGKTSCVCVPVCVYVCVSVCLSVMFLHYCKGWGSLWPCPVLSKGETERQRERKLWFGWDDQTEKSLMESQKNSKKKKQKKKQTNWWSMRAG